MNSPAISYTSRPVLGLLMFAFLVFTPIVVQSQDYSEEEYQEFQAIQAQTDATKKFDMILAFLKQNPKSGLTKYISAEYQNLIVDLQGKNQWKQIISLGTKYLGTVPNDDFTFSALAAAYSATNNTKGFASFGEKAYQSKPTPELALAIARSYLGLGNDAKFLQWARKVVDADPGNVEMLDEMTRKYMARQDMGNAVKYSRMTLKALPNAKKPSGVSDRDWQNQTNTQYATAYYAIGSDAYQKQNYSAAIKNLDNAVKYYKRNDYAYYFLGVSYWQMNKLDAAMLNFAKAYLLKGSTSSEAKKHLEQLWKSGHRNSLTGVERVIQRAQQDLK